MTNLAQNDHSPQNEGIQKFFPERILVLAASDSTEIGFPNRHIAKLSVLEEGDI